MARAPEVAPQSFPDWVASHAQSTPDRIALITSEGTWTYAKLDDEVTRLAHRLSAHVAAGDRIAALLPNGSGYVMLVHALLRLRATLVPLNTRLSDGEVAFQLRDVGAGVLIVDRRTRERARHVVDDAQSVLEIDDLLSDAPAAGDEVKSGPDLSLTHASVAVLAIIYTSGTTGQPKGAMLTVANFWWSAWGSQQNIGTREDDRWLAVLPLFHVGGLSIVLRSAIYGTAVVVHDSFDAEAVNRAIDDDGITLVSVVAVMLQRMLDARGDKPYPESLRAVLAGGGPVPIALLERAAQLGLAVSQTYGLTETTSQIATLPPPDALRKVGSAGRALQRNEIRIEPMDDVTESDAGEILVRGPVVMAGYANDQTATDAAIVDGWLHTGDIGRMDADGYLYVLDRRDDLIITGGENVYPAEVEAVLLRHPEVMEVGVIGLPDAEWGQRVVAVVKLNGSERVDASALASHCRAQLAGYKVPREIRITDEPLPRTAAGKLKRSALRAREELRT